jgi:hypothetical protein
MTVVAKCILQSKYAENTQVTQYTATGVRTIVDKFTGYNGTGGAVILTVNLVPSAGSAGATNVKVSKSIAAGETYTFPEIVGQILNAGDFISTIAGAASSIVIRISGREVS